MELNVTNKIAIPISPMLIAMAAGKLRIDTNRLSKSFFGTTVATIIEEADAESTLTVKDGKFVWKAGHAPFNGTQIIALIDGNNNIDLHAVTEDTQLVVKRKIDANHSQTIDNLTKVYYTSAYVNSFVTEKTGYGDYRGVNKISDPLKAANNDATFNLLCKRVGIQIDPSLHQNAIKNQLDKDLKRFGNRL